MASQIHLRPDTRICTQLKFLHLDRFLAPNNLYRDTAPVPATKFVTGDKFVAPIKTCTAIAPAPNKICIMTAKKCAIPSLHRDSFLAKVPGSCPDAGRVTQPPHIAGPLGTIVRNSRHYCALKIFTIIY